MFGKKRIGVVLGMLAMGLVLSGGAWAAGPEDKVWKQVEMVRLWKLSEILDLDEAELAKILPILKEYDRKMRELGKKREKAFKNLHREARKEDGWDKKMILAEVRNVLEFEREIMEVRQGHFRKMETILPPERLAKYMIFDLRFHDEIENFMRDMRHRRGKGERRFRDRPLSPDSDAPDLEKPGPPDETGK